MRQAGLISFSHYIIFGCAMHQSIKSKKEDLNAHSIKCNYFLHLAHISIPFW